MRFIFEALLGNRHCVPSNKIRRWCGLMVKTPPPISCDDLGRHRAQEEMWVRSPPWVLDGLIFDPVSVAAKLLLAGPGRCLRRPLKATRPAYPSPPGLSCAAL